MYNGYRVIPGFKEGGAWRWPPTPSSDEVQEKINLQLYSPSRGPGVVQRLRHCATSRAVPGSNPCGVGYRDFSRGYRQNHVPWGQLSLKKMSNRDSPGGKGGRCVRLTTYHPFSAERQEIRGLNLSGPPWAISTACCGRDLYPQMFRYNLAGFVTISQVSLQSRFWSRFAPYTYKIQDCD